MGTNELYDVKDAVHMAFDHGIRFNSWYFSKRFIRKQLVDFPEPYEFMVVDYNYRFVMPMKIDLMDSMIAYSEADRELGVFRFPRDENGTFIAPKSFSLVRGLKGSDDEGLNIPKYVDFSDQEVEEILKMKPPLVFEAFRIPQFGFEFYDLSIEDIKEIRKFTNTTVVEEFLRSYNSLLLSKIEDVKAKILNLPNYLLILKNMLHCQSDDMKNISDETGGIIYI